jgi:hypothetical protein
MRNGIIGFAIAWFGFQLAPANDFRKSYTIPPNSQVFIENSLGNIKLTSYKGKTVELIANKKGPEGDSIEINEDRSGDRIGIYARNPRFTPPKPSYGAGAPKPFTPRKPFPPPGPPVPTAPPVSPSGVSKASVDFEIRVPQSIEYKQISLSSFFGSGNISVSEVKGSFSILTGTGSVEVSEVKGHFSIQTRTGSVEIRNVIGQVTASSTSGTISVYLAHTNDDPRDLNYSSVSGNVIVRAPANLSAIIDMRSQSGLLQTDFPLNIQEARYGPGKFVLGGQLGKGKDKLRIYSNFGQVSLMHK